MTTGNTLLFTATDVDPADEAALNDWYDNRHVPQRVAVPGFLNARRWEALEGGPKYLALYDLAGLDVLQTAEYKALSQPPMRTEVDIERAKTFKNPVRVVMQQIAQAGSAMAPAADAVKGLLMVSLQPEAGYEDEFNDWYTTEHIEYGARVPGLLRVRRFKAVEGSPTYVALWELADPNLPNTQAWRQALDTPWAVRIRQHYARNFRGIYKQR